MKKLPVYPLAFIFALSLAFTAYAKEAKDEQSGKEKQSGEFITKADPSIFKANDIIGANVENLGGEALGKIVDLGIDPKTGRVAFVVIAHGGSIGIGEKDVALPLKALSTKKDKEGKIRIFVLNMTEEQLSKAPKFDKQSLTNKQANEKTDKKKSDKS